MAAAVLLQGVPANPSGAVAYQLKEALGLVCTPQLLLSPPTPGGMCSAMCFFGSATDREKVLAVGVVAVFGVRVRVSAGVGQASKPTPAPKRIRMTVDASGNEELMDDAPDEPEVDERIRRALLGMQAGDAIAAPIHWYYTIDVMKEHLRDHFGAGPDGLRHYAAVPSALHGKHPDSWNYMKAFDPSKPEIDIVHEKKRFWNEPGHFYHSELAAGEVTHTVALSLLLLRSIAEDGGYDWEKYVQRYLDFWRTPGANSDTYVEIVHRHFFERLAAGAPLHACGMEESCLSGFAVVMPLVLATYGAPEEQAHAAIEAHLRLTHNSDKLVAETRRMTGCMRALLGGAEPKATLAACFDTFFEPKPGEARESCEALAALDTETLFIGQNPYANAGEPGCARFSLR